MAWNEPGGSKDRDPWGNRGGNDGPPDLDEVLKKFQDKLTGLFGGKGGKGGKGSRRGSGSSFGFGLIAAVALVIWFLSGIYIVNEGKQGVVLQFGAFSSISDPGFHWYPRFIQTVDVVDVANIRSVHIGQGTSEALMLTKDQNIVDMEFVVQYHVQDAVKFLFAARDPEKSLQHATQSAVRELAGNHTLDYLRGEGRSEFALLAQKRIQNIVDVYDTGFLLTSFNLQVAQPPREVIPAYNDVLAAGEDRNRYINEAIAYRNDILPKAQGQQQRMIEEAEGYKQEVIARATGQADRFLKVLSEYEKAPKVTRQRMYIETMESILANTDKVVIDVEKGNNMLYLPLGQTGAAGAGPNPLTLPPPVNPAQSDGGGSFDSRRDRQRSREVR